MTIPERSQFPFALSSTGSESPYLTRIRNRSRYWTTGGFLDYVRALAVLIRGILINFLIILPPLLLISAGLGSAHHWLIAHPLWISSGYLVFLALAVVLDFFVLRQFAEPRTRLGQRNFKEKALGWSLILLMVLALIETSPWIIEYMHQLVVDGWLTWQVDVGALSSAFGLATFAGRLATKSDGRVQSVLVTLGGIGGVSILAFVVLFCTHYVVYGKPLLGYWIVVPQALTLFAAVIAIAAVIAGSGAIITGRIMTSRRPNDWKAFREPVICLLLCGGFVYFFRPSEENLPAIQRAMHTAKIPLVPVATALDRFVTQNDVSRDTEARVRAFLDSIDVDRESAADSFSTLGLGRPSASQASGDSWATTLWASLGTTEQQIASAKVLDSSYTTGQELVDAAFRLGRAEGRDVATMRALLRAQARSQIYEMLGPNHEDSLSRGIPREFLTHLIDQSLDGVQVPTMPAEFMTSFADEGFEERSARLAKWVEKNTSHTLTKLPPIKWSEDLRPLLAYADPNATAEFAEYLGKNQGPPLSPSPAKKIGKNEDLYSKEIAEHLEGFVDLKVAPKDALRDYPQIVSLSGWQHVAFRLLSATVSGSPEPDSILMGMFLALEDKQRTPQRSSSNVAPSEPQPTDSKSSTEANDMVIGNVLRGMLKRVLGTMLICELIRDLDDPEEYFALAFHELDSDSEYSRPNATPTVRHCRQLIGTLKTKGVRDIAEFVFTDSEPPAIQDPLNAKKLGEDKFAKKCMQIVLAYKVADNLPAPVTLEYTKETRTVSYKTEEGESLTKEVGHWTVKTLIEAGADKESADSIIRSVNCLALMSRFRGASGEINHRVAHAIHLLLRSGKMTDDVLYTLLMLDFSPRPTASANIWLRSLQSPLPDLIGYDSSAVQTCSVYGAFGDLDTGTLNRIQGELSLSVREPKVVFLLTVAAMVSLGVWLGSDLNLSSVHGWNRDRLASTFLMQRIPKESNKTDRFAVLANADVRLSQLGMTSDEGLPCGPYHLINTALNLQGSSDASLRDRGSDFFLFSKNYFGSDRTSYCPTSELESVCPEVSLASAMAISAAAGTPNMGRLTSGALVPLLTLMNIRMGYWLPHPGRLHESPDRRKGAEFERIEFNEVVDSEAEDLAARWELVYSEEQLTTEKWASERRRKLVGLAMSGGGIRSAAVNLGIAQVLHAQGIFQHVDYLSTVSGGGYTGSAISCLMGVASCKKQEHDLASSHATYASLGQRIRWRVTPLAFLWEILSLLKETSDWVNLSDGGHIENLGVMELLRRRCKYIIVGDGEADPRHTFNGAANLIRTARLDLGVDIKINLDPVRLRESESVSYDVTQSHFAVGRIFYPEVAAPDGTIAHEALEGCILYLKSSLIGEESEVIREYKSKNKSFPHESTADQFFDEAQFEAYRALGEQIASSAFGADENLDDFGNFCASLEALHPTGENCSEQDDLTVLPGLGSASQQRLYDAEITTLQALARQSPERLRQIVGTRPDNVESWPKLAAEEVERQN